MTDIQSKKTTPGRKQENMLKEFKDLACNLFDLLED